MIRHQRLIAVRHPGAAVHGGGQWGVLGPDPARLGEVVPADVNDPWYPPAPEVRSALETAVAYAHHTPEVHAEGLRRAVAEELGVDPESLLLGAGSSPILHYLITQSCGPRQAMLVPAPTYSEYERVAQLTGAPVYRWLLAPEVDFAVDPAELARAAMRCRARLVVLPNPNNPSGQVLSAADMSELARRLPAECRLLIDEAYVDQAPEGAFLDRLAETPRAAVVRSLSKGAGLAGVRLGFGVVGKDWAPALPWETPPWPINIFAQAAALPALRSGAYVRRRVAETRALCEALARELAAIPGLVPVAAATHFFLLRLGAPWPAAPAVVHRLAERGVLVRDCTPYGPPLGERFLRLTARSAEENHRLAGAFRNFAEELR